MHSSLTRIDSNRYRVSDCSGVDVTLFANDDVPIEKKAIDELQRLCLTKQMIDSLKEYSPGFLDDSAGIHKIAVTPEFHKGNGIPIGTVLATKGFVVPAAVGNDINCGMRLNQTSLDLSQFISRIGVLKSACRHAFFEGGRNIPMSRRQREGLLRYGIPGLFEETPAGFQEGLWNFFHRQKVYKELDRINGGNHLTGAAVVELDPWMGPPDRISRDSQTGSIGGGNHFVEFLHVARIWDKQAAFAWGFVPDQVVVMIHTGSVSVGQLCGSRQRQLAEDIYPKNVKHPENHLYVIPDNEQNSQVLAKYFDSLHNAANFAFANRLFLSLMARAALEDQFGEVDFPLLWDSPHNLIWREKIEDVDLYVHRKGACPARSAGMMKSEPFCYFGEPVLVPGSMGASSFVMAGQGNVDSLFSASHGAGRALSRGKALKSNDDEFKKFLRESHVVTPVDLERNDIKSRPDILKKQLAELKQESPIAYKGIADVIGTLQDSGIAHPVVELRPLLTIKA